MLVEAGGLKDGDPHILGLVQKQNIRTYIHTKHASMHTRIHAYTHTQIHTYTDTHIHIHETHTSMRYQKDGVLFGICGREQQLRGWQRLVARSGW